MPMIQIKAASPHAPDLGSARIAALAARLSTELLGKDPAVTAVVVEQLAAEAWFCAGKSLAEQGKAAFWLDIRVTDGTNSKDELAAFIQAAFDGMAALLGPLHEESYVHVVPVRADSYGYGGQTQERRYIAARLR